MFLWKTGKNRNNESDHRWQTCCRVRNLLQGSPKNCSKHTQHTFYMQENSMKKLLCWKLKKKSIRFSYHASYEWNIAEQYFGRIRIIALYMHISGALWPTHRMKFIQFRCGNLQQFGTKLKSKSNVFSCFLRIPCASWIILASKFEAKNWKKNNMELVFRQNGRTKT